MDKQVKIHIQQSKKKTVKVTPEVVRVKPGDKVVWKCTSGNPVIDFGGISPFPGSLYVSVVGEDFSSGAAGDHSEETTYKYDVSVMLPGGATFSVDPEVVVDPGGPGATVLRGGRKRSKKKKKKKKKGARRKRASRRR